MFIKRDHEPIIHRPCYGVFVVQKQKKTANQQIKSIYSHLFQPRTYIYIYTVHVNKKRYWVCKVQFGPSDRCYMIHVPSFRYFIFSICWVIARTSWKPVLSPDMCWKYVSFSTWTDRLLTPASFKMVVTYELVRTTEVWANKNKQWHQIKVWGTIKRHSSPQNRKYIYLNEAVMLFIRLLFWCRL